VRRSHLAQIHPANRSTARGIRLEYRAYRGRRWYRPHFQRGLTVLFKKLFQVLVVGGAVAGVHACATGSAAKSSDASSSATREGSADGGTAAAEDPPKAAPASAGGGVMGW
jgi:hypothetical protein